MFRLKNTRIIVVCLFSMMFLLACAESTSQKKETDQIQKTTSLTQSSSQQSGNVSKSAMVTTPRPTPTPTKQKATPTPKPTATPVIPTPTSDEIDALPRAKIVMENGGEIVILLYKKRVTKTVENFISLAKKGCLLYTSPSPRDATLSRMPSSA